MGKVCKTCGIEKDLSLFNKCNNKDGHNSRCRECEKSWRKTQYPKWKKRRTPEQKERRNEYNKEYRKIRMKTLEGWAQECLQSCRGRKRDDCSITRDDILELWEKQKGICALTGQPMDYTAGIRIHNKPSLDRIDNSKGYHKGNVRLVWLFANSAKNIFTDEQLVQFCEYVIEHHRRNKT